MQITTATKGLFSKRYETTIIDAVDNVTIDIKVVQSSKTESVEQAFQAYAAAVRVAKAF